MLGYLNDLWRYRVSDNTWTWMSGSNTINQEGVYDEKGVPDKSNVPGARYGAAGWFDSPHKSFGCLVVTIPGIAGILMTCGYIE